MLKKNNKNYPRIEFDVSFVEEAVFLAIRYKNNEVEDSVIDNFHNEREKIYQDSTDEDRNTSFQRFYNKYFNTLGIRDIFEGIVRDFPLLHQPTISLFIKKVWTKMQEDTELYVQGDFKTVYIALMVNRILQPFFIQAILRHDLLRISDMLDPNFQYNPYIHLDGKNELENNLIKDRFRLLWDMYIHIRLRKKNYPTTRLKKEEKREFEKTFFFLKESERRYILSKLEGCENLMHIDLLNWAQDARGAKTLGEGGVRCPLCDFTCYEPINDWPPEAMVVVNEVKKDHPRWTTSLGICPQCFDLYRSRVRAEV